LDASLSQLADQAAAGNDDTTARSEAAKARIGEFDRKIAQYRASLDVGGDRAVIGPWMAGTQAQRVAAQAGIRLATGQRRMTRDEIAAIVTVLGDLMQVIRDADPADKADLYTQLGLTMTYRPQRRLVQATVTPSLHMCKDSCPRTECNRKPICADCRVYARRRRPWTRWSSRRSWSAAAMTR